MMYLDEKQREKLYNQLEVARGKYKPEKIDLLFVAEAPPNAIDRFFYYENVTEADYLYLGIIRALDEKFATLPTIMLRKVKKDVLQKLKECGIFLMDLCPVPLAYSDLPLAELHRDFMNRLEQMDGIDKKNTNIILIKVNVYDCLYEELKKKGYKVINKRIPFPASGQQKEFQRLMHEALEEVNLAE